VLIAPEGTGVRLVATDSYRLALRDIDGSDAFSGTSQILVPARALAELQRLSALGSAAKSEGNDGQSTLVGLSIGDHDVTFTAGDVKVSTRLLDGTYPDYRQLICHRKSVTRARRWTPISRATT
jgi:DNA polymerase-3 subunit beta